MKLNKINLIIIVIFLFFISFIYADNYIYIEDEYNYTCSGSWYLDGDCAFAHDGNWSSVASCDWECEIIHTQINVNRMEVNLLQLKSYSYSEINYVNITIPTDCISENGTVIIRHYLQRVPPHASGENSHYCWNYLNGQWLQLRFYLNSNMVEDGFFLVNPLNSCVSDWSCNSFGTCGMNNISQCMNVVDLNTCGFSFSGDLSDYNTDCEYVDCGACGLCKKCSGTQCVNQNYGEDLKNECNTYCNGKGSCNVSDDNKIDTTWMMALIKLLHWGWILLPLIAVVILIFWLWNNWLHHIYK